MYYIYHSKSIGYRNSINMAKILQSPWVSAPAWHDPKPFTKPWVELEFAINSNFPTLDNYETYTVFSLYSIRLVKLLKTFDIKCEDFPARVVDKKTNKRLDLEYRVFRLFEVQKGIDWIKSDFDLYDGYIQVPKKRNPNIRVVKPEDDFIPSIRKLVLSSQCLKRKRPMFILAESPGYVLIHEDVKHALDEANITGCEIVPLEDYQLIT